MSGPLHPYGPDGRAHLTPARDVLANDSSIPGWSSVRGHHPHRMHDEPGDQMPWLLHQEIHKGERDVLGEMGYRKDAFNRHFGNVENEDNLPPRRGYGIDGPTY